MKNSHMIVYRIVRKYKMFIPGETLLIPNYGYEDFSNNKKEIEMQLESVRQKEFNDLPSRLNSLYVCHSESSADYWATSIFGKKTVDYYLLHLRLENIKKIAWLDSDKYMEYPCVEKDLPTACKRYWDSATTETFGLKDEYEGLFVGNAIIDSVTEMRHNTDGSNSRIDNYFLG